MGLASDEEQACGLAPGGDIGAGQPGDGADGLLGALVTPQVGDVADGQGPGVTAMPILVDGPGDIEDLDLDWTGVAYSLH